MMGTIGMDVSTQNGICTIKFNKPNKLNAIASEVYAGITEILEKSTHDASVNVICITGEGKYFTSGNDLSASLKDVMKNNDDPKQVSKNRTKTFQTFVNALIDFPKPIVCAVNGPAVGIGVTMLGLVDLVYASDKATFYTPFTKLGLVPEACSSYVFPKLMGCSKANEVLLAGKKLSAQEALDRNLVTAVIPHHEFHETINQTLSLLSSLPRNSLIYSKDLIRRNEINILKKVNEMECERLKERWSSGDVANAMMLFFQKKSKL